DNTAAEYNIEDLAISAAELTPVLAKQYGYEREEGVLITNVDKDGLAAYMGVEKGDLLQAINKKRVRNISELQSVIKEIDLRGKVILQLRSGIGTKILQKGR
ncbi:MAG: PDZ domain-containing protein, partial [Planctomycetota bacterium]